MSFPSVVFTATPGYAPKGTDVEIPAPEVAAGSDDLQASAVARLLAQRLSHLSHLVDRSRVAADPLDGVDVDPAVVSESTEDWRIRQEKRLAGNRELSRLMTAAVSQANDDRALRTMTVNALSRFSLLREEQPMDNLLPQIGPRSLAPENDVRATNDFFDGLQDLINLIGSDYLEIYEHLIERYSAMFKDFNEKVMARMSEWIKGVEDGKKVQFNGADFRSAVMSVINTYSRPPASVLFPVPGDDGSVPAASRQEALDWAKAMGLPESQVVLGSDGNYFVQMDLTPLRKVHDSMPHQSVTYDSAKFQAWQTGFNTQEAAMKNYLQIATSKYSNANSYHDNFIKILSSQLSQFAEMLKAYLS